ncbi:MAG: DEAD/DEAH box helicase [Opitutales bacterium]
MGSLTDLEAGLETGLLLPDLWQQQAIRHLQAGRDVVVDAPTGSGKTYVFEQFFTQSFRGQAVFTVPTRALANDKLYEWRDRGWNTGIQTGDVAVNLGAPLIVATLETQRGAFLRGAGPNLLVIDEYQMLADDKRGVNYELALAMAPPHTQLLLLSGSVANPEKVVSWLRRIGREAVLTSHKQRPVPQEEVFFEALRQRIPKRIRGYWPRRIARALAADLGPILMFAPRRHAAESLARQIAGALPCEEPLLLSPEQKTLAGEELTRLLRNRIAFHHSGLTYQQRAGLIEPLAKAGQLRVVVATTGLSAGINFSMRSVVVTDREYRTAEKSHQVRPDELLQMFGRAGRRGLDDRGYILVTEGKPRLAEAAPLKLRRTNQVDWPTFVSIMANAKDRGTGPLQATQALSNRLFSDQRVPLGLRDFLCKYKRQPATVAVPQPGPDAGKRKAIVEMQNSGGGWERRKGPRKCRLGDSWFWDRNAEQWIPALASPVTLAGIEVGSLCKLPDGPGRVYGREVPLARFPEESGSGQVVLVKWIRQALRSWFRERDPKSHQAGVPRRWDLVAFEQEILPLLPKLTQGGRLVDLVERKGMIHARLSYRDASIFAWFDGHGKALLNPPLRKVEHASLAELRGTLAEETADQRALTPAEIWFELGLITHRGEPTRRGMIFSFFNHGEGLAVAVALEDPAYATEDLLYDLANLRAGHRFDRQGEGSGRLRAVCRQAYRNRTYPGYLRKGVPSEYGEGAAEVVRQLETDPQARYRLAHDDLRVGDIERASLEFRSLLQHVAKAPEYPWDRWMALKTAAIDYLKGRLARPTLPALPRLTAEQRARYQEPV